MEEERMLHTQEVTGSSPVAPTTTPADSTEKKTWVDLREIDSDAVFSDAPEQVPEERGLWMSADEELARIPWRAFLPVLLAGALSSGVILLVAGVSIGLGAFICAVLMLFIMVYGQRQRRFLWNERLQLGNSAERLANCWEEFGKARESFLTDVQAHSERVSRDLQNMEKSLAVTDRLREAAVKTQETLSHDMANLAGTASALEVLCRNVAVDYLGEGEAEGELFPARTAEEETTERMRLELAQAAQAAGVLE